MTKNGANEVADLQSGPFVSYAREDQPFVRKLHEALHRRQRDTWVNWKGIFPTEEWMAKILRASLRLRHQSGFGRLPCLR